MRIIRAINPTATVEAMKDKFLSDDDYGDVGEFVRNAMEKSPGATYITQAWDGVDLKAFLVAFAYQDVDHVWLFQAWSDLPADDSTIDRMFLRLCLWTESLGRGEIRGETKRSPKTILRRWKFDKYSEVRSFKLDEDLESKILVKHSHEELLDSMKEKPKISVSETLTEAKSPPKVNSKTKEPFKVVAPDVT